MELSKSIASVRWRLLRCWSKSSFIVMFGSVEWLLAGLEYGWLFLCVDG
jgi:hypothetical protein